MLINAIFGLDLEFYGRDRLPGFNGHYVNFLILVLPVVTSKRTVRQIIGFLSFGRSRDQFKGLKNSRRCEQFRQQMPVRHGRTIDDVERNSKPVMRRKKS